MNDTFVKLPSGMIINARYLQYMFCSEGDLDDMPYVLHLLRTSLYLDERDGQALEKILLEGNSGQ